MDKDTLDTIKAIYYMSLVTGFAVSCFYIVAGLL